MRDRSDDQQHHEQTLYHGATSRSPFHLQIFIYRTMLQRQQTLKPPLMICQHACVFCDYAQYDVMLVGTYTNPSNVKTET